MPKAKSTPKKTAKLPAKQPNATLDQPQEQDDQSPEIVGSQQAYERFLPQALALDPANIRGYRADAVLAYHNITTGVDALTTQEAIIKTDLPKVDYQRLIETTELALGVIFAVAQVDRSPDGTTTSQMARAWELRDAMLTSADSLVKHKIIPLRAVQKIREGKGKIDAAQDCVDLAALFTKYAKEIKGKTPVTSAEVKEAALLGTDLLGRLKRKGSRKKASPEVAQAVENRDRLWSLLVEQHREIRRVGMWLWMDEVDEHVPPLQSRVPPPRKKKDKASGEGEAEAK